MADDDRQVYLPPADDEPLDALQLALVKMWARIVVDEVRAELEDEQRQATKPHDDAA